MADSYENCQSWTIWLFLSVNQKCNKKNDQNWLKKKKKEGVDSISVIKTNKKLKYLIFKSICTLAWKIVQFLQNTNENLVAECKKRDVTD